MCTHFTAKFQAMETTTATAAAAVPEAPSCEICFDGFNKSTRKQVTCAYCSHNFCRGCVEQYVLSQGEQIVCPETECRMPWLEEFVDEQFTAVFRGSTLRKHREKFVLDREKARLPELQERARRYKIALEGKDDKHSIYVAAKEAYLKESIPAEAARLEAIYNDNCEPCRLLEKKLERISEYKYIPSTAETGAHYKTTPKPGKEEEYEEIKKQKEELGKQLTAAYTAWREYERANTQALETAKKKHLTPARQKVKCPEFKKMVDSYGAPVRIWLYGKTQVDNLKARLVELYGEGSYIDTTVLGAGGAGETRRVVEVTRGCPAEGCRGFLNGKWVCGVCDTAVCRHCHEVVDLAVWAVPAHCWLDAEGAGVREPEEVAPERRVLRSGAADAEPERRTWHRCSPPAVETARLLVKETKPCPTCRALISKIDGCDQMWCTQCQTAFSWATGQKEEGRVHNPHYYEWLRRTQGAVPREPARPGDVGFAGDCCAEENRLIELPWFDAATVIGDPGLDNHFTDVMNVRNSHFEVVACDEGEVMWEGEQAAAIKKAIACLLSEIHRRVLEVYQYDVANRRNWYETYADQKGVEDAIDFLVGGLTEDDWLKRVWCRDRLRRFRNDVKEIKRMFYAAGRDLLNSFTLGRGSVKAGETIKSFVELFEYANAAIIKARKRYCLSSSSNMSIAPGRVATYLMPAQEVYRVIAGRPLENTWQGTKEVNQLIYGLAGAKLPSGVEW